MTDIKLTNAHIMFGNAMERLKELPDNSVDSIVTDPPYGLNNLKSEFITKMITEWTSGNREFVPDGKGFMGKEWDCSVPPPAIWDECLRVLKPGGHLLAFFGSRTQDIGALSIRLAGFEIRDSIAWVYGSGFPKSLDISKAIDKQAGAERKLRVNEKWAERYPNGPGGNKNGPGGNKSVNISQLKSISDGPLLTSDPTTDAAKQWQGWGTALKPAIEPIVVARKPISESTVANNVLKWGTGGLNIDASRIGTDIITQHQVVSTSGDKADGTGGQRVGVPQIATGITTQTTGRFPANIILDEETAKLLDEQSGVSKSTVGKRNINGVKDSNTLMGDFNAQPDKISGHNDFGGASRFFYVAKASKKDRNEGLEKLPVKRPDNRTDTGMGSFEEKGVQPQTNFHPTVKPTTLMEYLIKLVTPVGGTVLDPFTGSGSTGKAALLNGFKFIGCELTEEYLPIIEGRLKFAENKYAEQQAKIEAEQAETLFDIEENE